MPFLSTSWISGSIITLFVRRSVVWTCAWAKSQNLNCKSVQRNRTRNMANTKGFPKPPNVLIYTEDDSQGLEKYKEVENVLLSILNRDSYVTYRLDTEKVLTHPWSENAALLIIATNNSHLEKTVQERFTTFLTNGGKILSLCSSFCPQPHNMKQLPELVSHSKRDDRIPLIQSIKVSKHISHSFESSMDCVVGGFYYEDVDDEEMKEMKVIAYEQESNQPLLVQIAVSKGTAFLSQVHLEIDAATFAKHNPEATDAHLLQKSDECRKHLLKLLLEDLQLNCASNKIPSLTPFYLLSHSQPKEKFLQRLELTTEKRRYEGKDVAIEFVIEHDDIPDIQENLLPVIINNSTSIRDQFDDDTYFSNLQTKELGRIVLYSDVVTSTQHILEGIPKFTQSIPEDTGVVVVCKQQVKGKGRSGNAWLSPLGCMMFSLMVRVKVNSELGRRLPYLQHIASLAVVEAVRSLDGYEDIDVRLKWPNDIYYGRSVKIGGVIVSSSVINNTFTAIIGVGVNLSNNQPTVCINELIQVYNRQHGTSLEPLSTEHLLARTVTNVEQFIKDFQTNGNGSFLEKYYKRWLHSDTQVTVSGESAEVVTINGLDEFGFLSVERESGEVYSVQPDGNSFDMLRNLILMKQKSL